MGGNSIGIEYPYEGNSNHYQLWKPPNGYFPRGEAPPPYEEAVALAQSEAINTQCTVSVATTTHRSLPIGINPTDNPTNEAQPNITTSTTNLINININSAGGMSADNHQAQYSCGSASLNQPRSTQTHSNCSSSSSSSIGEPSNMLQSRNTGNAICGQPNIGSVLTQSAAATTQVMVQNHIQPSVGQAIECTYKNCTLNSKVISSKGHKNTQQDNSGSNMINSNGMIECADKDSKRNAPTTILPPPLFDEDERRDLPSNGGNEIMKTPSSSRRYHRTIPRHFTAVDPLLVNVKNTDGTNSLPSGAGQNGPVNKKPICQCPVQHVPMTYMGANHFTASQGNSNVFLSTLTTKLVSTKASIVPKTSSSLSAGKIPTISKLNNDPQSLMKIEQNSASGTLRRSSHHHSSSVYGQGNGSTKIATISKQIGELRHDMNASHGSQVQSILKTPTPKEKACHGGGNQNSHNSVLKANSEVLNAPFPIQFIDGMSKVPASLTQNPVLPPKLYKNQSLKQTSNPLFVSKIHTISKPSETMQPTLPRTSSIPRTGYSHQLNSTSPQTKSLPRKEEKITPTLTLPASGGLLNAERSQSLGKINSATFYPMQSNHATYTLPKQSNGKMSLNSTIASVVSKVPSVISIPSPSSHAATEPSYSKVGICISENIYPALNVNHLKCEAITLAQEPKPSPTDDKKFSTLNKFNNGTAKSDEKPLPVCTTSKNCSNPKEHFLPNDTSLDDDYLSECENCKTAHSSRYYLDEEIEEAPQETMTLQRKMDDKEEEQAYYRASLTLPTNTKKTTTMKNNRETWFSSIPASSSSDEEQNE